MEENLALQLNLFNSLTESQEWTLCLYAFGSEGLVKDEAEITARALHTPVTTLHSAEKTLISWGLLVEKRRVVSGDKTLAVKPQYYFIVARYLIVNQEDWLQEFDRVLRNCTASPLWVAAEEVCKNGFCAPGANHFSMPQGLLAHKTDLAGELKMKSNWQKYDYTEYLLPYLDDRSFETVFRSIRPEHIVRSVHTALARHLRNDSPDAAIFDRLRQLLTNFLPENDPHVSIYAKNEALDAVSAHQYFYTARQPQWKTEMPTVWKLVVYGINSLYHGNTDEAKRCFTDALKINSENGGDKRRFANVILNYYLLMVYAQDDTAKSRGRVSALVKQSTTSAEWPFPLQVIAKYQILSEPLRDLSYQISIANIRGELSPLEQHLLELDVYHFHLQNDSKLFLQKCDKVPNYALLRYEMSAFKEISDKENLIKSLGNNTLLSSFHIKEKWEVVLEDVMREVGASTPLEDGKIQNDARIVYVITTDGKIEIREQKILRNGRWSVGNAVNISDFYKQSLTSMDDVDCRIAHQVNEKIKYYELETVLPFLVDSDRVFVATDEGLEQVSVTTEKAMVWVEKTQGSYNVQTNLPSSCYGFGMSPYAVKRVNDNHYTVFMPSKFECMAISKLMSVRYFPHSAEKQLKECFGKISQQLEIHSDLLEGGSSLSSREAQNLLVVKILPIEDKFSMTLQAQPLEGGRLRFSPGEGRAVIFDECDGVRYQVHRNLAAEQEKMTQLADFCDTQIGVYLDQGHATLSVADLLILLDFLQENRNFFLVEWPEGQKLNLKATLTAPSFCLELKAKEKWFEVEGSVKVDEKLSLKATEFLQCIGKGLINNRFIRLNETDYVSISDSIIKYLQRLEAIAQQERNKMKVPMYQIGALEEIVQGAQEAVSGDDKLKELEAKVEEAAKMEFPVPSTLQAELRDYQADGFRWMARLSHWGAGACLADDMGLGKTVQTITFLLHKAADGPSLVICPSSVVYNWARELRRFAPSLQVHVLNATDERAAMLSELKPYEVVLSTYGLLVREEECLSQIDWNVVCLDEAHVIKNRNTKMSKAAMNLQSTSRLILTGTPLQNNLAELWNLFQFINPGLLGGYDNFVKKFILPIEQGRNRERQQQLRRVITPFLLRRTKREVIDELPAKEEVTRYVEMTKEEVATYEAMRRDAEQKLKKEKKMSLNVLSQITRLREAACSIGLVDKDWTAVSSKIVEFKSLVNNILAGGNRVLVFSQFTTFLSQAKLAVEKELTTDEYCYLDGATTLQQREKMVQEFQHGKCKVFFISLKAGGVGLNLTGANYVIHLDPWWNPAIEQQATDRAYRIGQDQNVTVYHLITRNSIEEKIIRLHKSKRDLADALLTDTDVTKAMTLEDLRNLVQDHELDTPEGSEHWS